MGSFLRTPLGLFTAIVVVGLVLILAAMSAFGSTSSEVVQPPTPLTKAQFKHAGQGICLSLRRQLRWLAHNKPRNLRQVTSFVARGSSIFDQLTTKVDALIPPASAEASWRRLQRNLGAADRGMHRLNHLTATRQWRRAYLLVHSRWWKSISRRLGPPVNPRHMSCGFAAHATV